MGSSHLAAVLSAAKSSPAGADGLRELIETGDPALEQELLTAADQVRREQVGDAVHLRALIEFSNHCARTCAYCGLRAANHGLSRYRLTADEIMATATAAVGLGYKTVVLQSGEDAWFTREIVSDLVRGLKTLDVAVTLALGERSTEDYAAWQEAGADRYLLRIETSDPMLYARLHPGMSYANRQRCLDDLRDLGYQIGSGVLVGLPGQTAAVLAQDLLFLQELQPDMVGLGPFIPHPGTPLAQARQGDVELVLKMMALTRLLLPRCHLVATTALGTIDAAGRERGLRAGANVMMPNMTPPQCRARYEIYPGKVCLTEDPERDRDLIAEKLQAMGRHIAEGYGQALRKEESCQ